MTHPDQLRVPASMPAPVLRVGAAVLIVGGVLLLNPYPMWWTIAVVSALLSALVPRSMGSWVAIACLAMGVILTEPSAGRTALAVLLVHVAHVVASWAWAVPWRSRIRLRVLLSSVRRLLVIQAIAQTVAAVVVLAVPPLHGPGFSWLAPLGAAVLAGASAIVLRLSTAPRSDPASTADPASGANVRGRF